MHMPKLSIIVPVYNVEKYLSKCLDSILYPDLTDYEIIVVNDGSTDSSPEIAAEYERKHESLVRLISTPNGGLGAARDVGIRASAGDFLVFLDSDDYLAPNAVPEMLDALKDDFDICLYDLVSVNEDGLEIGRIRGNGGLGSFSLEECPELLTESPCACNKIFRRELFTETDIAFPSRVWYEDLRTVPKLYPGAKKIVYFGKAWYMYLQRSGSITNSADAQRNLEIIDAVDDLTAYYREHGLFDKYREQLEYIAFHHAFLASATRVNFIDARSPVQDILLQDYLSKHPDYKSCKFFSQLSFSHKLIHFLVVHKWRRILHLLILANNFMKRKKL